MRYTHPHFEASRVDNMSMASAEKPKKVPLYKQRTSIKEGFKELKKALKARKPKK